MKLSVESIIGLIITHTPTIAIGVYGIICVFQKSNDKFKDMAKIVLLICLPYGPFASVIIGFESIEILKCAQKILGKTHSLIYPWFLPQKGDDLKLFLGLMQTIFGSCLSICYNSVLMAYTVGHVEISQMFSLGQLFYFATYGVFFSAASCKRKDAFLVQFRQIIGAFYFVTGTILVNFINKNCKIKQVIRE